MGSGGSGVNRAILPCSNHPDPTTYPSTHQRGYMCNGMGVDVPRTRASKEDGMEESKIARYSTHRDTIAIPSLHAAITLLQHSLLQACSAASGGADCQQKNQGRQPHHVGRWQTLNDDGV